MHVSCTGLIMSAEWLIILSLHIVLSEQIGMTCEKVKNFKKDIDTDYHVRCQGQLSEKNNFDSILSNFSTQISIFELYDSLIDILPENIFGENTVRKIVFTHSSLSMLSLPEHKETFFHSVEKTLESLEIYECSFAFAWNMSILSSLSNLKSLIIENSELITVGNYFQENLNLSFIQIAGCEVKWIHQNAFQKNENLRICSLSSNAVKSISRSIFPKPALHLWSLDLSYNRLQSLPEDMFEDMEFLKELKLDNNLVKINGEVLKRVWGGLTQLWINGNSILCWKLCPLIVHSTRRQDERPLFFNSSKCYLPMKQTRSYIMLDYFMCNNYKSEQKR